MVTDRIVVTDTVLDPVTISSGTQSSWSLTEVDTYITNLTNVRVDGDPLLLAFLKYDKSSNKLSYNGNLIAGLQTIKKVQIELIL